MNFEKHLMKIAKRAHVKITKDTSNNGALLVDHNGNPLIKDVDFLFPRRHEKDSSVLSQSYNIKKRKMNTNIYSIENKNLINCSLIITNNTDCISNDGDYQYYDNFDKKMSYLRSNFKKLSKYHYYNHETTNSSNYDNDVSNIIKEIGVLA